MAKKGKKDAELEAERLAEEEKAAEEAALLEEEKRYGTKEIQSGLKLYISEYIVQELWENENPKEILKDFLKRS